MANGGRLHRRTEAGTDGQNYLASVSDLVSAFIFVFIVMLAIFAYRLASATEEQAQVTSQLRAADEVRDSILAQIATRLDNSGMRVQVLRRQGILRLAENAINFPLGSETPVAEHEGNVGIVARAIAEVVPCYVPPLPIEPAQADDRDTAIGGEPFRPPYCQSAGGRSPYDCQPQNREYAWLLETLLIEGHTDDVPVAAGSRYRDNIELSSMRAATVHRMIAACEPDVERLANSSGHPILSTSGYGDTRPAVLDPERRAANRRIDLRFLLEPPAGLSRAEESAVEAEIRERIGERQP